MQTRFAGSGLKMHRVPSGGPQERSLVPVDTIPITPFWKHGGTDESVGHELSSRYVTETGKASTSWKERWLDRPDSIEMGQVSVKCLVNLQTALLPLNRRAR